MLDYANTFDAFERCTTIPDAKIATTDALAKLGLTQFVYLCWSQDTLAVELSIYTYSHAWTDRYVAQGYEKIDPVIGTAFASKAPFIWAADDYGTDDQTRQFFDEADGFGLYQGVTIPLKTQANRRIFVTFAAPKNAPKYARLRHADGFIPAAKFIAMSFHMAVCRLRSDHLALLTVKEATAMKMAATGLSSAEIADCLSLAKPTVDETLNRAARKMGLESRSSACHFLSKKYNNMTKP